MATDKSFKARVNCNFSLQLNLLPEYKEKLNTYKIDNDIKNNKDLPLTILYAHYSVGDIINFGDKIEIDEDTLEVLTYPVSVFERESKHVVMMPCQAIGNVKQDYKELMENASPKMKKILEENKETETSRATPTPRLTRI